MIAEVVGYNKKQVWVRVPREDGRSHVILTLARSWLTRGFAQFRFLHCTADYATLRHNGHGFTMSISIEGPCEPGTLDPGEGSQPT